MRRYETLLLATGNLSGKTILDFGCGKGDLYGFLRDKGVSVSYCGIDVNDNLIELAKHKYPQAEFISLDIDEDLFLRRFVVIIAIGVFNLRIAAIEESMKGLLKKLFPLCRESLHVNFLTYYVPRRNVELFYACKAGRAAPIRGYGTLPTGDIDEYKRRCVSFGLQGNYLLSSFAASFAK